MAEPYLGTILLWPGPRIPENWAACDGALIDVHSNIPLFALLGTTYGGNGKENFALPDFRGRAAICAGKGFSLSNYTVGQTGGSETVTLQQAYMPVHTHAAKTQDISVAAKAQLEMCTAPAIISAVISQSDTLAAPACNIPADIPDVYGYGQPSNTIPIGKVINPQLTGTAAQILPTGGSAPHNNLQPYLPINYIICVKGTYPQLQSS